MKLKVTRSRSKCVNDSNGVLQLILSHPEIFEYDIGRYSSVPMFVSNEEPCFLCHEQISGPMCMAAETGCRVRFFHQLCFYEGVQE